MFVGSGQPDVGETPLIYASQKGHFSIVKLLLEHKANIEGKDEHGMFLDFFGSCI